MIKIISKINRLQSEACGWLNVSIILLLLTDLTARLFGLHVGGSVELATFFMVASIYLGLSHCEEEHGHVRMEAIVERLSFPVQKGLNIFTYLLSVITIGITFYAVAINAIEAYEENEAIASITPLMTYPVKFLMAFTLIFFLLQLCINLGLEVKKTREDFEQIPKLEEK